jgi:hypothetical protein
MSFVDCRNDNHNAPRRELASGRFTKQAVSQLPLTDGMKLSQQVVGLIMQCAVAQVARLPLPRKSQALSGGLVKSRLISSNSTGLENVIKMAKRREAGYGF